MMYTYISALCNVAQIATLFNYLTWFLLYLVLYQLNIYCHVIVHPFGTFMISSSVLVLYFCVCDGCVCVCICAYTHAGQSMCEGGQGSLWPQDTCYLFSLVFIGSPLCSVVYSPPLPFFFAFSHLFYLPFVSEFRCFSLKQLMLV